MNQKGQQQQQNSEKSCQKSQSVQQGFQTGVQSVQNNEKGQVLKQHEILPLKKQQSQQQQIPNIQQQFIQQQQQQTQYQANIQTQHQSNIETESQHYQQGGGCLTVQQGSIIVNREKQASISQMSTAQIPEDQQRSSLSMKSTYLEMNQNTSNQISSQGTQPNISSLRNIPNVGEKTESTLQPFELKNKIQSSGSTEQNMDNSSNCLNQMLIQNNTNMSQQSNNNYNSSLNTAFNSNINNPSNNINSKISNESINNNLPIGQSMIFHSNQQAASNLNPLQQTPNVSQLNFLNSQQQPQMTSQLINAPFSQISSPYQYVFRQAIQQQPQFAPNTPSSINFGLLQIQSKNFVNQQQPQQQQQSQQIIHSQVPNQLQLKQPQVGVQSYSSLQPATLSSPHHQQIQQAMQQQQQLQKNYNQTNTQANSQVQNNQIQDIKQMTASSQIYSPQLQTGSQANMLSQTPGGYQQNTVIASLYGFPPANQVFQSAFPAGNNPNQMEMRNLQESFSMQQNLSSFQQNAAFSEKTQSLNDKKSDIEILPSKPNSIDKYVLQSHELQNQHRQQIALKNQNLPFQQNQKIKKEEEFHRSPSSQRNFVNLENNQLQKYSDRFTDFNAATKTDQKQPSKKPKRSSTLNQRLNDKNMMYEDIIGVQMQHCEAEYIQQVQRDENEKRSIGSQARSIESGQVINQKLKKESKKRKGEEIHISETSQNEKNCELTDDKSLPQSRSSGLNSKNPDDQFQITKESKNSVSSQKQESSLFSNKKRGNQLIQRDPQLHQFESSQNVCTKVIEFIKQKPFKKVKTSKSDNPSSGMNTASFAYLGDQNTLSEDQTTQYQKQWPIDYEKIFNLQKNIISESKPQQSATAFPASTNKISTNQPSFDQSNLKQFHEQKDNLPQSEKSQEFTKFAGQQPFSYTPNLPEQIQFQTRLHISNPVQYDFQRKFDVEQNQQIYGQNQDILIQQTQNQRMGALKNQYGVESEQHKMHYYQASNSGFLPQANAGFSKTNDEAIQQNQINTNNFGTSNQGLFTMGQNFASQHTNMQFGSNERNQTIDKQPINANQTHNQYDQVMKQGCFFNFLLDTMSNSFDIHKNQYEILTRKLEVQSQLLMDTINLVKNARQDVDEMILQSTDIQGQSGLLDYMRGRIKEYIRGNPDMQIDYDGTQLDAQTSLYSRYELVLKEGEFKDPLIKDKNFIAGVQLIDINTKKEVCNLVAIPVRLRMYTYNNPPAIYESDYIKGNLNGDVLKGTYTFRKIHIKQVTSHQKQRAMFIVIEPDIELLFNLPPLKLNKPPQQTVSPPVNTSIPSNFPLATNESTSNALSQQLQLEKPINIKQESQEKQDDALRGQKQEGIQSCSNLNLAKSQLIQQQSQVSEQNPQSPLQKPKKRASRKKKESDKNIMSMNKLECEVINYKINPILIKPLILEQIIVKSKNNVSSKS